MFRSRHRRPLHYLAFLPLASKKTCDRLNEGESEPNDITQSLNRAENRQNNTKADMTPPNRLRIAGAKLTAEQDRLDGIVDDGTTYTLTSSGVLAQKPIASGSNIQLPPSSKAQ